MKHHLEEFNQIRNIFANKAGVKEITLDTEGKTSHNVAEEIMRSTLTKVISTVVTYSTFYNIAEISRQN